MGDNTKMKYSQDKADKICALIIDGWTIRDICKEKDLPSVSCLFKWLREHEDFEKQYARAKEEQAEIFVAEMTQIADDGRNDWMEKKLQNGDTVEVVNHEHIQRSKLRIDTRKWLASKFKAKKYGDRVIHAGDEDAPLTTKDVSASDKQAFDRFVQNYNPNQPPEDNHDDIC